MKTIDPPSGGINRWHTETLVRRALDAGNEEKAWKFITALHWRGTKEVFDIAANLCVSKNHHEREVGADILGQLGSPDRPFSEAVLEILRGMLRTEQNPDVLQSIIVAIGHTQDSDDSSSLDLVIDKRNHENEDVRHAVAWTLGSHSDRASVSALIELMNDSDDDVRDWATFGLGDLLDVNNKRVRGALWQRVSDSHADTKHEAILGLAKRHDERVRPLLMNELEKDDPWSMMFEAAVEFGDPTFLPRLQAIRKKVTNEQDIDEWWLKNLDDAIKELQNRKKGV